MTGAALAQGGRRRRLLLARVGAARCDLLARRLPSLVYSPLVLTKTSGGGPRVSGTSKQAKVGVIGGSGFYELLDDAREVKLDTPFGAPSDSYFVGDLGGVPIAFLPRHARGHRILPCEVNYRANIWGMKALGVEQIVSASAVGSLREELKPLDIVVPDQLFDRTKARPSTFFGEGVVVHMGFADPFCPHVSAAIAAAGRAVGATVHEGGTYVCIEGPQFSTRAESHVYRRLGHGRHRHDQPARGQAGPRGRAVLCAPWPL